MKNFIKKILVSFGYRSLGLDHNNEHSKWGKPVGHCVLIATIIDENPCDARKNPIPNVIKNVGDIFVAVSIGVNKSANSPPRTFDNNVDTKSFDIFKYELV